MVAMQEHQLSININTGSPVELRDNIIMAIAAAMRWKARDPDAYIADGENQYVLAQLLEELIVVDNS